jgi:hypothetical protein
VPGAAYGTPALDPLTAPLLDVVLPAGAVPAQASPVPAVVASAPAPPPAAGARATQGWPCSRCEAMNELTDPICHVCGTPFLAAVSEESKVSLVLPLVGDISRYGRGQRALIAFAAIVAVLVPLAIITLLLTKSPPAQAPTPAPVDSSTSSTTTTDTVPAG